MRRLQPNELREEEGTACDFRRCESLCCYDGVYLSDLEIDGIWRVVQSHPEVFPAATKDSYFVEGCWQGVCGRKTAVVAHDYQRAIPAHFNRTRCVLADGGGACLLEAAAIKDGKHRWSNKPEACWRFPLRTRVDAGKLLLLGPPSLLDDPDAGPGYPGFASCVPCAGVANWRRAFAKEVEFWLDRNLRPSG